MTRSEIVGENIRRYRNALGMSQSDFADAIHRAQSTVALYESGQRLPSTQIMSAIAKVLGISFGALYFSEDERQEHDREPYVDDVTPTFDGYTAEEGRLVRAYRDADERARADAMNTLLSHPVCKKENLA